MMLVCINAVNGVNPLEALVSRGVFGYQKVFGPGKEVSGAGQTVFAFGKEVFYVAKEVNPFTGKTNLFLPQFLFVSKPVHACKPFLHFLQQPLPPLFHS